jgi:hypothetical protein
VMWQKPAPYAVLTNCGKVSLVVSRARKQ